MNFTCELHIVKQLQAACKPPFLASALLSPVAPKSNWLVNNKWRCLDRHRRIDDLRVELQVKVDHLPKVSVL